MAGDEIASISSNIESDVSKLRKIIPEQKLSPVVFEISNGKIIILPQASSIAKGDQDGVDQARDALIQQGRRVIDELGRTNCDRRVIESVVELQGTIEDGINIVKLGIINASCAIMCEAFREELPEAVSALLRAQTAGIGMYVAQFPEWVKFTENAALVDMSDDDIKEITSSAMEIERRLEGNANLADPKVPRTIKALRELVEAPSNSLKRAAFALIRTIENLVSKIFQYSTDYLDKTAKSLTTDLSFVTSKVLVASLLSIALVGAGGLGAIAPAIGETAWAKAAAEIIKSHLANIK